MIAVKQNFSHIFVEDLAALADAVADRIRRKLTSGQHCFKKTNRIDIYARYPQYREETLEEKNSAARIKVDLNSLVNKDYDDDFLARLRRFLEFLKRIFKSARWTP